MRSDKAAIVLVACVFGGMVAGRTGVALAGNTEGEGRRHARKANHLADLNRCKLAIPEYTKAIRLLKDPALLYNRAQCYRRIGAPAKAVADYRRFLVQLPAAPNRAQVESQIAALENRPGRSSPAAAAHPRLVPIAPSLPPAPPAPVGARASAVAEIAPARPPMPPPAPRKRAAPEIDSDLIEREPPASRSPPAPLMPPVLAATDPPETLVDTAPRVDVSASAAPRPSNWWLWVVGAVVVAGGATATYLVLAHENTDVPKSALGNYRF